MIFAVAFLGSLFAILAALLVVYTYVMLRLIPRFMQGISKLVKEIGPKAVFERANLDPVEAMRELGLSPAAAAASIAVAKDEIDRRLGKASIRVVFTCEDHGRCDGCPKVLAQFEAIVRHQGAQSFDEVERKCYEQLAAKFPRSKADVHDEARIQ
jgi:hypothetical protein